MYERGSNVCGIEGISKKAYAVRNVLADGFYNIDPDTTDEEIQKVIADRTGVVIPLDNITMKAHSPTKSGALVAFEKQHISDILTWALSEDSVHGRKIQIAGPLKSADH